MVLSYTHPYTNTVRQDRNQAVCALQTEPIVCRWAFNGPTAGHKEHITPACCQASHWPILGHREERRQLTPIPLCACIFDALLNYTLKTVFCVCFPFHLVRFLKFKDRFSSNDLKVCKNAEHHGRVSLNGGTEVAGCLSEVLCTRTHTCTHTYINTTQPLPLTPSCTAA